jgi:hypothetical protein
MTSENCLLCHPRRIEENEQWLPLCPEHWEEALRLHPNMRKVDQWIRQQVEILLRKAENNA